MTTSTAKTTKTNFPINRQVIVRSEEKIFEGIIEKKEWDTDQWIYFIKDEWYCQSEVHEYKPMSPQEKAMDLIYKFKGKDQALMVVYEIFELDFDCSGCGVDRVTEYFGLVEKEIKKTSV